MVTLHCALTHQHHMVWLIPKEEAATADITNNATINAGSGTVTAVIDGGTGLTNDQPGNISLGTITAGAINATGDSATGTITGTSLTGIK